VTGHYILGQIQRQAIVTLGPEELGELLELAETVREVDTCLSGWIRILTIADNLIVQEQTPEGEVLVRRMASIEDAERFVEQRLIAYERMWDGCGCRIDYRA
jgi:hypothetical protein